MASRLRRLLFCLLPAILLMAGGASAAAPQPMVKDNRIIDSVTSKRFVPHGVNFPGFEYACQQGWSYGEDGTEPDEVGSTVAAMASWKINTVRLPLNADCWLGKYGLPEGPLTSAGYRQAVENFVSALNSVGIVAILDLHWSNPDGVVAEGLRPMPDQNSPDFWSSVASRFKDNKSVIFDLFNEPHSRWNSNGTKVFGLTWDCWANGGCQAPAEPDTAAKSGMAWYRATGMKELTTVVRNAGATQPIILSGIDYANDLRGWLENAPNDGQLIAGFHNYPGQRCHTSQCWNEEIAPVNLEVPVLAAEFGQNDCGTPSHVNRFMEWADDQSIGYLAWALALRLGQRSTFASLLRKAAPMHDIGKIGMPDGVLKKPGGFTPEERAVMNQHPAIGAEILGRSRIPLFQLAAEVALSHHERWDGSGYPSRLAGEAIPLSGRIVAVVDFFDALTMDRCYRPAFSDAKAIEMLRAERGRAFDPRVVDCFLEHIGDMIELRDSVTRNRLDFEDLTQDAPLRIVPRESH